MLFSKISGLFVVSHITTLFVQEHNHVRIAMLFLILLWHVVVRHVSCIFTNCNTGYPRVLEIIICCNNLHEQITYVLFARE